MRWWLALPLALVASTARALADLRVGGGQWLFAAVTGVACVAAVLAVRATGLLAAMAQPPVVVALAIGVATAVGGQVAGASALALTIGSRATGAFPVRAATTAGTLLVGGLRVWRRRRRVASSAR